MDTRFKVGSKKKAVSETTPLIPQKSDILAEKASLKDETPGKK